MNRSIYSDCLRRESNFLASTHPVTALCVRVRLLHCIRARLRINYTRAYAQIMQHMHTHKVVTRRVEPKKLLSRRRQSNYSRPLQNVLHTWSFVRITQGIIVIHTLRACCSQSELRILKIRERALFLYNFTPNTLRARERSVGCIHLLFR